MVIIGADELKADIKAVLFSRQFHFVIIGESRIFKGHHQTAFYLRKVYFMILGAVQMFKWLH